MTQILKKGMKVVDLCDGCIHILDSPGKYPRRKDGSIDDNIEVVKQKTLLNVPMPADEGMKTIRNIYESNPACAINFTVKISYENDDGSWYATHEEVKDLEGFYRLIDTFGDDTFEEVIIISITPVTPTYSVGDQVMILAKRSIGVIGVIKDSGCYGVYAKGDTGTYHRSEICKIA